MNSPKDSIVAWWGQKRAGEMAGAYQGCLGTDSPQAKAVMNDLARLCFAGSTTLVITNKAVDPLLMAFNEGKRSVFLHVCDALGLSVHDFIIQAFQQENQT